MQPAPSYLGENYLAMMLQQIEGEGYSVFAVKGKLDDSSADRRARALLRPQNEGAVDGKELPKMVPFSGQGYSLSAANNSNTKDHGLLQEEGEDDEETMLAKAIQASMETNSKPAAPKDDMDEIRRKRLARFG